MYLLRRLVLNTDCTSAVIAHSIGNHDINDMNMRGKPKRRSNIFKLGRRGRRGRVSFDKRWGKSNSVAFKGTESNGMSSNITRGKGTPVQVQPDIKSGESIHMTDDATDVHEEDTRNLSSNETANVPSDAPDVHEETTCHPNPVQAIHVEHQEFPDDVIYVHGDARRMLSMKDPGFACDTNECRALPKEDSCNQWTGLPQGRDEEETAALCIIEKKAVNLDRTDMAIERLEIDIDREFNPEFNGEEVTGIGSENIDQQHDDEIGNTLCPEGLIRFQGESHTSAGDRDDTERDEYQAWSVSASSLGLAKLLIWQNIVSLLLVTGTVRLSVTQFDVVRACMNALLEKAFPGEPKLPAYRTIRRTMVPLIGSWGFVQSEICTACLDLSKAGARQSNEGLASFKVVKPSAWSALDVSNRQTWELLKTASNDADVANQTCCFQTIEGTPMLRQRDVVLNVLSQYNAPFDDVSTSELSGSPAPPYTDCMWTILLGARNNFPEQLCSALDISRGEDQDVSSVTVKPLRTVLVISSRISSNFCSTHAMEVELGSLPQLSMVGTKLWHAGDYCTALRPRTNVNYLVVLVHHQALPGRLSKRFELICVPYGIQRTGEGFRCIIDWRKYYKVSVSGMSLHTSRLQASMSEQRSLRADETNSTGVPSYGRLQNGMRYFVDHILLYSDGFSQYQHKQGSAGGVYSVSLNYPPHLRRSRESVRVLALTPPGVSTTEGLRSVIDDLVTSSTEGRRVRNADGEEMIVFTDVVAFVCDYHEVAEVLDVVGHSGRAPCHLCSFLRYKGHHTTASRYSFSTSIHGWDACYARSGPRMTAIRGSNITDDMLVSIGLKSHEAANVKRSPLIQYYHALTEKLKTCTIPLTELNRPVLNPRFDPYRSLLVAPDHMLAGIAINELTLAFKVIPPGKRRKQADRMICQLLHSNGLLQQSEVFNCSKSRLNSTSISGTFCILLVGAPAFTEIVHNLKSPEELSEAALEFARRVIKNFCAFRELVSRTYWYPRTNVDDPKSVAHFNCNAGMKHISSLQDLCTKYMSECNAICKLSLLASQELDKPNVHRLLELYRHSIPAMGHVHHFAELLFECAHQPLKRGMANSNFKKSHIQSMTHAIADDWKRRLAAAFAETNRETKQNFDYVLSVLCGRDERVMSLVSEERHLQDRTTSLIDNDFMNSVIATIPMHMDSRAVTITWRLTDPSKVETSHIEIRELIRNFLVDTDPETVRFYLKAQRIKIRGKGRSRTSSHSRAHENLTTGTVVQALVADDSFAVLLPGENNSSEHVDMLEVSYFAIEKLLTDSNQCVYAAVRKCTVLNQTFLRLNEHSATQLLKLNDSVRRICVVHACNSDPKLCCIQPGVDTLTCTGSLLSGNLYHFFNRENGYPPRMA